MEHTGTTDGLAPRKEAGRVGAGVLREDLGALATDAKQLMRDGAAGIHDGADRAVTQAKEKLHDIERAGADAAASLKCVVARNPMASLGIAAGVGLVIGLLVFRPRS